MGMLSPDENGWVPEDEAVPLRKLADAVRAMLANESAPPGPARDRERIRLTELAYRALEPVDAYNAKARGWCGAPDRPSVVWESAGEQDGVPGDLEILRTDGIGAPIVELHWTGMTCECGRRAWTLWHAPEGGLMIQCECTVTLGLAVEDVRAGDE